jgi:hypothetical protein
LSPILVRPVREQLEHDRVIRQLQKDLTRKKVEVAINPGTEQNVGVGSGARKEYPDVILFSTDKNRKLLGVVEVETGESINYLEAMAEWGHYARLRAPLHLYVPMGSVELARRLAADNNIQVAEFHSYHQIGDLIRFASVHRTSAASTIPPPDLDEPVEAEPKAAKPKPAKTIVRPAARSVRPTKAAPPKSVPRKKAVKPAAKAKPPARPAPRAKAKARPAKRSSAKAARRK